MSLLGRYINPLYLVPVKVALPMLAFFLLGFTANLFGSGVIQRAGSLITGMYIGILLFGFFIEPKYLSEEGHKKTSGAFVSADSGNDASNG